MLQLSMGIARVVHGWVRQIWLQYSAYEINTLHSCRYSTLMLPQLCVFTQWVGVLEIFQQLEITWHSRIYSRMRHLWRHLAIFCLCNIVVCTTYDFLKKPSIAEKFKMADLDSCHSLKLLYILHCLSKSLHSESK